MKTLMPRGHMMITVLVIIAICGICALVFAGAQYSSYLFYASFIILIPIALLMIHPKGKTTLGDKSQRKKLWWLYILGLQVLLFCATYYIGHLFDVHTNGNDNLSTQIYNLNHSQLIIWIPAAIAACGLAWYHSVRKKRISWGMLATQEEEIYDKSLVLGVNILSTQGTAITWALLPLFIAISLAQIIYPSIALGGPGLLLLPVYIIIMLFLRSNLIKRQFLRLGKYGLIYMLLGLAIVLAAIIFVFYTSKYSPIPWKGEFSNLIVPCYQTLLVFPAAVFAAQFINGVKIRHALTILTLPSILFFIILTTGHNIQVPHWVSSISVPHWVNLFLTCTSSIILIIAFNKTKNSKALVYGDYDAVNQLKKRNIHKLLSTIPSLTFTIAISYFIGLYAIIALLLFIRFWPSVIINVMVSYSTFRSITKNKKN